MVYLTMSHAIVVHVTLLLLSGLSVSETALLKAKEGKCLTLKWGGKTGAHWFSCCNNCNNGKKDPKCDGITWQSASNVSYCGSCGIVTGGGAVRKGEFDCGGCDGQEQITNMCRRWWRKIPGFCWSFSKCFHYHCSQKYERGYDFTPDCYNTVCNTGETLNNCPVDCCYKLNPVCDWKNNKNACVPECCGEVGCCLRNEL